MFRKKTPPLGHARTVRTIPISAGEPVKDRRPMVPLEPGLAEMAEGLLPAMSPTKPSEWTSWAVNDQAVDILPSAWEPPIIDGGIAAGDGTGFPYVAAPVAPSLPALGGQPPQPNEVTTAAAAGWAEQHPTLPHESWVQALRGVVPNPTMMSQLSTEPEPATAASLRELAERDGAQAHHPSNVDRPLLSLDDQFAAPAASAPQAQQHDAPPLAERRVAPRHNEAVEPDIDRDDFLARLERGASLAMTEPQLLSLAQRAVRRLIGEGVSTWLTETHDETLTVRLTIGDEVRPACGIVESRMCPAIASSRTQRFDRSDELDACPQLQSLESPCAALCVPVRTIGPLRGVVFTTTGVEQPFHEITAELLEKSVHIVADRLADLRGIGS